MMCVISTIITKIHEWFNLNNVIKTMENGSNFLESIKIYLRNMDIVNLTKKNHPRAEISIPLSQFTAWIHHCAWINKISGYNSMFSFFFCALSFNLWVSLHIEHLVSLSIFFMCESEYWNFYQQVRQSSKFFRVWKKGLKVFRRIFFLEYSLKSGFVVIFWCFQFPQESSLGTFIKQVAEA